MDPCRVLPDRELLAVLRPGRSFLLRNPTGGGRVVLRRLQTGALEARRRAAVFMRAGMRLEVVEAVGSAWSVRPYVDGTPLEEALRSGPLEMDHARAAMAAVATAVAAFHARGVAHGAVHPGNVILLPDGTAALHDGLEPLRPERADALAAGYAAPEIVRGAPPSRAADVFALGVMAHAVMGEPPFTADTPLEAARRVLYAKPTPLALKRPDLDKEACEAVDCALAPRPWRRPLASALRDAIAPSAPSLLDPLNKYRGYARSMAQMIPPISAAMGSAADAVRGSLREGADRAQVMIRGLWPASSRRRAAAAALFAALAAIASVAVLVVGRQPEFAKQVDRLLDTGDVARARATVARAARERPKDPWIEKERGDVACARGDASECARAYRTALAVRSGFASDPRLRANVLSLLDRDDRLVVHLAIQVSGIDDALVELTRSDHFTARWNAVRALEGRGEADRIDYADVYTRDLEQGGCATKRVAAAKLTALHDPRILPRLEAAERRDGGFFGLFCAGGAIHRAVVATRAVAAVSR